MKKTLFIILLTAALALSACGSDGVLSTSPSDTESSTVSDISVAASESEHSDEESPAESSIEDESSVEDDSSVEDESSKEESSFEEESDIPEDPGSDLFDYGIPQRYLDGYIYYADANSGYVTGRVKPDGTDKTRYGKDLGIRAWLIDILDDKLLYIKSDYKLYSLDMDGSNVKCLSGDKKATTSACYPDIKYKDKIVFGDVDDDPRYGEYYIINPDGSDLQPIDYNDIPFDFLDEEWVYGHETFLDKRLYRYRRNNEQEKQYLTDFNIMLMTMVDDVIYCLPHDELHPKVTGLWRVNNDGSELKQLCDDIVRSYQIIGDYVYFDTLNYLGDFDYDYGAVYRMKTDGTEMVQLTGENTSMRYIFNGIVFAIQYDENNVIVIDTEGNKHVVLDDEGQLHSYYYPYKVENDCYFVLDTPEGKKLYLFDFEELKFSFFSKIE